MGYSTVTLFLDIALIMECASFLDAAWPITTSIPGCSTYNASGLHVIMDRVCSVCHEMYSHRHPNMRADCRSNCFRSKHFRACLEHFQPVTPYGQRKSDN